MIETVEMVETAETEKEIEESFAASSAEKLVTKQEIVQRKWMVTGEIEVPEEAEIEVEEAAIDLSLLQEAWIDTTIEVVAER